MLAAKKASIILKTRQKPPSSPTPNFVPPCTKSWIRPCGHIFWQLVPYPDGGRNEDFIEEGESIYSI